jgi:hypothetical protein
MATISGTITFLGAVPQQGNAVVYPDHTTTFSATFIGQNGGQYTCSATVVVFSPIIPVTPTTPFISLSQVPYTGLDLGPVGTVLYWSFLIIWCLVAAYLIAVKRVQNRIAAHVRNFLFGTPAALVSGHSVQVVEHTSYAPAHVEHTVHTSHTTHTVHTETVEPMQDDFITSQINRARN